MYTVLNYTFYVADSQLGINAAKESIDEIKEYLTGADLLFVVAGMGRGTGKGAGCVIAEIARDMGILTVGIVTKPFMFEIGVRWPEVKEGIYTIRHNVDAVLIIKNYMVVASFEEKRPLTLAEVYSKIYEVVTQAVKCVTDIIRNSNFADVKNILINADRVITGFGEGEGEDGIKKALLNAIESPFMTLPVQVAAGVLVSITTNGKGLNTADVNKILYDIIDPEGLVRFAYTSDESLGEKVRVSLIALYREKELNA